MMQIKATGEKFGVFNWERIVHDGSLYHRIYL